MRVAFGAKLVGVLVLPAVALSACASGGSNQHLPPATFVASEQKPSDDYVIGPLDSLTIFVWRNPELGGKVQVRPDGRISTPLIQDMQAVGRTPTELAADIKEALTKYVSDPLVSVMVDNFSGTYSQQVRVVGATEKPASLPYRANMTLLDAMIAVGGLNQYAAGNKARLVRYDKDSGKQTEFNVRISDLLKKGDTKANVQLQPGDVIIIPESMF